MHGAAVGLTESPGAQGFGSHSTPSAYGMPLSILTSKKLSACTVGPADAKRVAVISSTRGTALDTATDVNANDTATSGHANMVPWREDAVSAVALGATAWGTCMQCAVILSFDKRESQGGEGAMSRSSAAGYGAKELEAAADDVLSPDDVYDDDDDDDVGDYDAGAIS
jgi:hypothetical protein